MSHFAFTLIVISAVMHALWNLLVKRSRHKTVFIWWMFIASGGLFSLIILLLPEPFQRPDIHTLLMVTIGAVCFVLYHLFNGRAYRGGDLSVVYPLCQTSMIYVPIWGIVLLGERLSFPGVCGILLVIFGTYSIQLQRLSFGELVRPFRNLKSPSVRDALTAGFIYSIGSIAEKSGVRNYSPLYFTYILVLLMLFLMSFNMFRPKYRALDRRGTAGTLGVDPLQRPDHDGIVSDLPLRPQSVAGKLCRAGPAGQHRHRRPDRHSLSQGILRQDPACFGALYHDWRGTDPARLGIISGVFTRRDVISYADAR